MKKADLIKMLELVPDDAEIVVTGNCDEILGDYNFNDDISIHKTKAYKSKTGNLSMTISNYASKDDQLVDVWELQ